MPHGRKKRKTLAAQQAAQRSSLLAYLNMRNQAALLHGARAPGAHGETVPVDWLGGMTVVGVTEEEINKDLAGLGLTRADIRPCKYCGRLRIFGSRKTEVCGLPECRRAQWRTNKQRDREAQDRFKRPRLNVPSGRRRPE